MKGINFLPPKTVENAVLDSIFGVENRDLFSHLGKNSPKSIFLWLALLQRLDIFL